MRVARCVVLLYVCVCVALRFVSLIYGSCVPTFLWCLCRAPTRVLAVWVIPLIVASLRTLLAASSANGRTLSASDQRPTTHEPPPTTTYAYACTRTHDRCPYEHTAGWMRETGRCPFLPLANAPLRIRQGGGHPIPSCRRLGLGLTRKSIIPFPPSPHNLPGTIIQAQNYSEMQNQKSLLLTYAAPVPTTPISVGNPMTDALFQPHSIISSSARQPSMTNSDERR